MKKTSTVPHSFRGKKYSGLRKCLLKVEKIDGRYFVCSEGRGQWGILLDVGKKTWLVSDFYELLFYTSTFLFHEMEYFLPSGMKAF